MLNPFMPVEERLCPRHNDVEARPRFRAQTNLGERLPITFFIGVDQSLTHVAILFPAWLRPEAM